ncbi:MAG: nucleotidyltransferase domain-containing protein [Thermoplasmatota archaeon]
MTKNRSLTKSRETAIKKFSSNVHRLLKNNVVDIIIYGSVARGEATNDSDIDVIVVVKRNVFRNQMKLAEIAFDILLETGEYISVQTMKSKDLNRETIFLHNVRNDAIHAI